MRQAELQRVITAAKLFTSLALEWSQHKDEWANGFQLGGTKLSGQVRRASLELTRRLAEMRRT